MRLTEIERRGPFVLFDIEQEEGDVRDRISGRLFYELAALRETVRGIEEWFTDCVMGRG